MHAATKPVANRHSYFAKSGFAPIDDQAGCFAYLVARGLPSAMAATGIVYASEREAQVVIGRGGGLLALWTQGVEAIGLIEIEAPELGAVAILSIPTDDGTDETCGIWTGKRWASVHRHGTVFGVGEPLRMWSV